MSRPAHFVKLISSAEVLVARELKRRQKEREREARKAQKAAETPAKPAPKAAGVNEDELNPNVSHSITQSAMHKTVNNINTARERSLTKEATFLQSF